VVTQPGVFTPYSTVAGFAVDEPLHIPDEERERILSYETYEKIYWSAPQTFKISMRGTNDQPIYIPNARTIVNETAHYLLKGLEITPESGDAESPMGLALKNFLKRERFYSKFHTAKWSGVTRGDWILHITADPNKPEGSRISIYSVDPAYYFPEYDDDDIDRVVAVNLVEFFVSPEDNKTYVKQLRYFYPDDDDDIGMPRTVWRQERILETEGWWKGDAAKVKQVIMPPEPLPIDITTIPVYHFKNIDWQGQPFGSSELRGFESLQASINQTISDEELALALEGLGLYATDAPPPTDSEGRETDWILGPGEVVEIPTGSKFQRVPGITSVTPNLEHLKFLTDSLFEGSSTFRTSQVDVQLAESGVALAMKFLPTLAKLEQRDWAGTAVLENLWYDWKFWWKAYEGEDFTEQEILVKLGDKLPTNRKDVLNELNNMLDRQVIDRQYYRDEMTKLGYKFPEDIADRIIKEQEALTKARMFESPVNGDGPTENGNRSNNRRQPNESGGTEADQSPERQSN
jgi:hypothetical protein